MGRLEMIDVNVVGGPDVGARVARTADGPGTRLDIEIWSNATVPAQVDRVGVLVESDPVRRAVVLGPLGRDGTTGARTGATVGGAPAGGPLPPGVARPGDSVSHQLVLTDAGVVGWIGTGRHPGVVVVHRDGWLLTAWAVLGGQVLGPGETVALDPLWLGAGAPGAVTAGLARSWRTATGGTSPHRPSSAGTVPRAAPAGTVWLAGPTPGAVAGATPLLRELGVGTVVVDLGPGGAVVDGRDGGRGAAEVRRAVDALHDAGLRAGIRVAVSAGVGADGDPADLTVPGVAARTEAVGAALAATGVDHVLVDRCARTVAPRPRWGDASTSPTAALRTTLEALRRGLGPGPLLHLADAPLGPGAGLVDLAECTGAARDGVALDRAAVDAARLAPLHHRVWAASTGPLDPAPWGPPDAAALSLLAATTSTAVLTGDPTGWTAAARDAVRSLAQRPAPARDDLDPWGPAVAVTGPDGRLGLTPR